MRGCVLMASHNDSRAIVPVLAEVEEAARALGPSGIHLQVLLIDQDSSDDTADVARRAAATLGLDFDVLESDQPTLDQAIVRGFDHVLDDVSVDFIVTLDADGQHDGRQIPDLVRAFLARGSGLTIGSRWARGGSSPGTGPLRTVLSRSANLLVRGVTGVSGVHDTTTSFRVYRVEVADLIRVETKGIEGYGFFSAAVAITQAHGFSVDEVPITFRPRYSGLGKLTTDDITTFAGNMVAVRRRVQATRSDMRSNQAQWARRSAKFRDQETASDLQFAATEELTHLSKADRFLTWTADQIEPWMGQRVVDVGAGLGAISRKLAVDHPERQVVALEPAENLFADLTANVADLGNVTAMPITSGQLLASEPAHRFDSAVYISVLEHILDDVAELHTAYRLLDPGGTLAIFVPAMPSLYGSLDYKSGHYRRYDRDHLRSVIESAGFNVLDIRYLDVVGVVPYWAMYRVLNRRSLDAASSGVFDRLIVPASRRLQRLVPDPPMGKNLLAVARRP